MNNQKILAVFGTAIATICPVNLAITGAITASAAIAPLVTAAQPAAAAWWDSVGDNSPAKRSTVLAGASNIHKLEFLFHWLSNDKASTGSKRLSYRPLQNV
jgi:hypothetical protein